MMPHMSTTKSPRVDLNVLLLANDQVLVETTRSGIQSNVIEQLGLKLGLTSMAVGAYLGISRASVTRKLKNHKTLDLVASDRVVRYAQLWKKALHLWRSEEGAREWLNSPSHAFRGETPLQHAVTEVGSRQVEDLMGQLAYGIAT